MTQEPPDHQSLPSRAWRLYARATRPLRAPLAALLISIVLLEQAWNGSVSAWTDPTWFLYAFVLSLIPHHTKISLTLLSLTVFLSLQPWTGTVHALFALSLSAAIYLLLRVLR